MPPDQLLNDADGHHAPRAPRDTQRDLRAELAERLIGQASAIASIAPYVQMHEAGLSPAGRPAGVFLLLGPSGTGKTKTVEALADVLHGNPRSLLRIDCGEFQQEHEVAKLLGAPPGYVGHRESQPLLTPLRLREVTSDRSRLALVLFDEIEKASPAVATLLLGVLDKATLRLGDGSTIDFENSMIFLTSNLGAREMVREMRPEMGFRSGARQDVDALARRLEGLGKAAVQKRFSPEFVNRLDAVITYAPLDSNALDAILDQHLTELQRHLDARLAERSFDLATTERARMFLLAQGVSPEYGARELKRALQRHLMQPLATAVVNGEVPAAARVTAELDGSGSRLRFVVAAGGRPRVAAGQRTVLVVDDNEDLLGWLVSYLSDAGCRVLRAGSVAEAEQQLAADGVDIAFVDHILPDGDGVQFAARLNARSPRVQAVVMTGGLMADEERALCLQLALPVLTKPFPGADMLTLIGHPAAAGGAARAGSARPAGC